jgi:hypothetical protein
MRIVWPMPLSSPNSSRRTLSPRITTLPALL